MAAMERKGEICGPFPLRRGDPRKTSAEIVSEARRSLRVQSTHRPFTPKDANRQLFGNASARAERDKRPPSSFSLHAQHFDAPESRPGSGTRLSPLDHKPKFPVPSDAEDAFKALPKPPTHPLDVKRELAGPRGRLLRAESLTSLPPVALHTDTTDRTNAAPRQKQPSAQRHTRVRSVPGKPGPRRAASESRIKRHSDDSGVRATHCTTGQRTENPVDTTCREDDAETRMWNHVIAPLFQQIESVAEGGCEGSVERLCDLCDRLHGALAQAGLLGRNCKRRSGILRTLFRLIDLKSARLNLHIAKLCLALCVSGNNLLNICKLIFQISRSESNDILFQSTTVLDSLLDVLRSEDVSTSGEALLYCTGTLKFVSGNGAVVRLLLDRSCIGVSQRLMQRLHAVEEAHFVTAGHILVQLTATLRNLADHPDSRPHFVSFAVLPELCVVLRHHRKDRDICTNVSRIFSKLSSYSDCRLALAQTPDCYRLFLELLSKHHQKQDLVVRLLFTLGNLTAKLDSARLQLFRCDGSVEALLQLYDGYQRRGAPADAASRSGVGVREDDDVLVKLVRVLANMCIHPDVGPALAGNAACVHLLMETLELRSVQESEELMVNVAAAVNNLSFYAEEGSAIRRNQLAIAELLLKLVLSGSMDAMLEATRVYGNMSQSKDVRDFIMQNKVHRFAVTLLDSKSGEMCFSACGVLTNLALDPPSRVSLSLEGTASKLLDCLRDFGAGDWLLVRQICQALWNLVSGGSEELLEAQEREGLLETLTSYLDEDEALKGIENEDMRDFQRACWELEFVPVAQKLMELLQPLDETD